jgi:hypothetical protein
MEQGQGTNTEADKRHSEAMLRLRKELDRCDRERCGLLTAMEW